MREQLKHQEILVDNETFLAPSWEDMREICFFLACQMIEKGEKFDRLVTLAKGGWTWARLMADYLQIEEVASIRVKHYRGIGQSTEKPIIIQSLPIDINGESILLFDDVDDTGRSLEVAKDYLLMCGARSIKTMTLFHKTWSKFSTDYTGVESSAWIIFPHEVRETIIELSLKWGKEGLGGEEIKARFLKIGLNPQEVDFFLPRVPQS